MADWVRCNICCKKPSSERQFFLTNCGHLFCKNCIAESPEKCRKCENSCKAIVLTSQMKPEVEEHFVDLATLINKQHKKLLQVYEFQKSHWRQISKCHEKQEATLEMVKKKLPPLLQMEKEVQELRKENSQLKQLLSEIQHASPSGSTGKMPSPGTTLKRGHGNAASPYGSYSKSATSTPKSDIHLPQNWQSQVPRTPAGPSRLVVRTPPSNGMIGTPRRLPFPSLRQRPGSAGNTPGTMNRTANTPGSQEAITPSIFKASGTPGNFSPMSLGSPSSTHASCSQTSINSGMGACLNRRQSPSGSQYRNSSPSTGRW
ncbi:RING finger protein 212B isoform X2 [Nematostella vectensis]|uniref:RING finger protein 212B isoform X2 n=1 Tax=Nematostella vectensis TaxID=45351 RepID=UPI002076F648|nr:RING finger protein 212B isoform X2 [Nematostella vectensis]